MYAVSPTGILIKSTLEMTPGYSGLMQGMFDPDNLDELPYDGETDMDWNSQKSVLRNGSRVFIDENDQEWVDSDLIFMSEGDWRHFKKYDEHPRFPREDWRYEVGNDDTKLGYMEWLQHKLEDERNAPEAG